MKATKKLIGAFVALIAALAVSVGATFAWFTTRQTATVNGIEATVTTSNSSLEMKLVKKDGSTIDGQEWGYELDLSDFFTAVKLDALTYDSELNASKGGLKKFGQEAAETTTPDPSTGHITTGSFVEFYVAFRSQERLKIYLTSDSKVTSVDNSTRDTIKAWKQITSADYGGEEVAQGNDIKAKAANAVRVGFDTADYSDSISEYTYKGIWEPNADQGYHGTENKLSQDYEEWLTKGSEDNSLADKYEEKTTPAITNTGTSAETACIAEMGFSAHADTAIDYYYTYVHIYMWIEGTDSECFNNIFGDTVTIELHFEAKTSE